MSDPIYDCCIIGAGVIGCAIARELSQYDLKTIVVEKGADVCSGTSKANSGIVHAGYGAKPGSFKAKYNVASNPLFDQVCADLKVPFARLGTLVVAVSDEQIDDLEKLYEQGQKNGVPNLDIVQDQKLIKKLEPNLGNKVTGVLHAPTGGIVSPYELSIGLGENANYNMVDFRFNSEVTAIDVRENYKLIETISGTIRAYNIINAAGVYSDKISQMVGLNYFKITPRKGEYVLIDKNIVKLSKVLFPVPTPVSKGIVVSPTMHGHLFLGPNAQDTDERDDLSTTTEGILEIIEGGKILIPNLPLNQSIVTYAGLRAVADTNDFIIESTKVDGFVNVAGIQSPGLTASLAIAKRVVEILEEIGLNLKPNPEFSPIRTIPPRFAALSNKEREKLIENNPDWGTIICRCEHVTKAEVRASIDRPLGAKTLDGVKFRTRAQMGRCHGGFCTSRLLHILSEELQIPIEKVTKRGPDTELIIGKTKDLRRSS